MDCFLGSFEFRSQDLVVELNVCACHARLQPIRPDVHACLLDGYVQDHNETELALPRAMV